VENMDYGEYEKLCKQQEEKNEKYLGVFENDLIQSGLTRRTISKHLDNVYFYINQYLTRCEPLGMEDGCGYEVDDFLGYFFIRKCSWSTPGTIKTTAVSIKKFYKSMSECGYISKSKYNHLCDIIKENMEIWQDECKAYNNSSNDYFMDFWLTEG